MSTLISWTNETWNPVTGCSRVSEGCRHCYAEALSLRYGWSKQPWTASNAEANIILHPERLDRPRKFKPGTRVFTNSMSDMWHELVPDEFIADIFRVMNETPAITYQILTKRPERAAHWPGPWTPNIWMGASIEEDRWTSRADAIRACGAKVKFISAEPLLGSLPSLDLRGIDWLIVGGESGRGFRSMDMRWARELRDVSASTGTAFFFKQDSAFRTETRPWLVEEDGSCWEWHQYPGHLVAPTLVPVQHQKIVAKRNQPLLPMFQS